MFLLFSLGNHSELNFGFLIIKQFRAIVRDVITVPCTPSLRVKGQSIKNRNNEDFLDILKDNEEDKRYLKLKSIPERPNISQELVLEEKWSME